MAGWFELSKSSDNQFRFVLKAGNGETILTSELYTSKASAEKGIASVRSNSPQEERYEKKTASNGKFYFNLKAANHQIIGSSQMYATAQSRETGIASVKANGTSQTVKDNTSLKPRASVMLARYCAKQIIHQWFPFVYTSHN